MPFLPIARQSADAPYNGERMLNVFFQPSDTVSQGLALGRSGLTGVADVGRVRALIRGATDHYALAGGKLWRWNGTAAVDLGDVPDDPVMFLAASATQVAATSGGDLYLWDGSVMTMPSTGAVDVVGGVAYLGGYFIVWGDASGREDGFQVSALRNGATWDPLDILFAESAPDEIRACAVYSDRLFVFGARTTEVWYNAGAGTGALRRDGTPIIPVGIREPKSAASDINGLFFIGSDDAVRKTVGTQTQVISTPEIQAKLVNVTDAFVMEDRGHKFYVIRRAFLPALCYDIGNGLWSERSTGPQEGPWIGTASVEGLFGTTAGLATQSADVFTDDGAMIRAEVVTPPIEDGGNYVRIGRLTLNAKTGYRNLPSEAQVVLQSSGDGRTWGPERWAGLGGLGDYSKLIRWSGLGASRWRQFRIWTTAETDRDWHGLRYD